MWHWFSATALPIAEIFLLSRRNVNLSDVIDQIIHISLFWVRTVGPLTTGNLHIIGAFRIVGIRLGSSMEGAERMGGTEFCE